MLIKKNLFLLFTCLSCMLFAAVIIAKTEKSEVRINPDSILTIEQENLLLKRKVDSMEAWEKNLSLRHQAELDMAYMNNAPKPEGFIAILVPLGFFVGASIISIFFMRSRSRERLAAIEKGLSTEEIKAVFGSNRQLRPINNISPLLSLRWGLLIVGAGIGLFVADHSFSGPQQVGVVCIWSGIGLIAYYLIALRVEKKQSLMLEKSNS
jgi:hypothetical protein